MQTSISDKYRETEWGKEANDILRSCVHCGFCTATCPTYQLTGDELDGPRGRIYQIKQLLEGSEVTVKTRTHLDRCLTCRSCETTCPSGVKYSHLLDSGRHLIEERVPRSAPARVFRKMLATFLTNKLLFNSMLVVGRTFSLILPQGLRRNLDIQKRLSPWPTAQHDRSMLLLTGCVQPGLASSIDLSTARVFDRLGISMQRLTGKSSDSGCCGAVHWHLSDTETALQKMKANIDTWWPAIENGTEALVMSASACTAMIKEYGYYLRNDTDYADKAARVSALVKDVSEVLRDEDLTKLVDQIPTQTRKQKVAFHSPCTLQHGQGLQDVVENILTTLGFELAAVTNPHLCCGAAGTYSIFQKQFSKQLLRNKLASLLRPKPDVIATANIGCMLHLQTESGVEVRHWIELLDF